MRLIVLAAGLTIAAACAGAAAVPDQLAGRDFLSTGVTQDRANRPLVAGTQIRLSFKDGQASANAGCNHIGGSYRVDGGVLVLDAVGMTEMGCDPDRHAQDDWLAKFLTSRPSLALIGDDLTLTSGGTVIKLLDRRVADPDAPLVGRKWRVVSVIARDTVSSVPEHVVATIQFAADGSVHVDTSCNIGNGRATVGATTIRFSQLALTRRACESPLGEMEFAMLSVLQAREVAYTIEAKTLTLRAIDRGLQLRAD